MTAPVDVVLDVEEGVVVFIEEKDAIVVAEGDVVVVGKDNVIDDIVPPAFNLAGSAWPQLAVSSSQHLS